MNLAFDLLAGAAERNDERAIVMLFQSLAAAGALGEDRLPIDPVVDTVVYWVNLPHGQADIVAFHADGAASVIEVKDGDAGARSVLAGIGQVGYYAIQLGMARARLKEIRRALLWTSTGSAEQDARIEMACEQAGVVPLPWGLKADHLGMARAELSARGF
ncbi:MAG TPA: hypothetical protein P5305_04065 [Rubrivivax sp.]|nr:hypothetical protein [Rubrivivax sp.]HRY87038.1 hypothetical protein [Rubrivivax sp.]